MATMNVSARFSFVTALTFARIPLVLLFFTGALVNSIKAGVFPWLFAASLGCLIAAALSDLCDGFFARKFRVTSKFGACADPLTDKIFYLTTLPLLVFLATRNGHTVHAVVLLCLTVTLLLRDQWVSFLRSVASGCDNADLSANWSGKARTAFNFPLICIIYYFEASSHPFSCMPLLYVLEATAFVINLVSLYIYTDRYWPFLRQSMETTGQRQN